jgi:hypothetical protein
MTGGSVGDAVAVGSSVGPVGLGDGDSLGPSVGPVGLADVDSDGVSVADTLGVGSWLGSVVGVGVGFGLVVGAVVGSEGVAVDVLVGCAGEGPLLTTGPGRAAWVGWVVTTGPVVVGPRNGDPAR